MNSSEYHPSLQSPAKNVVSALQSGGNKIHGVVLETLSKRDK
jgi:large subunit ribosomal protein L10